MKAWRVKLLSSWGFDSSSVIVLTSTSYLKCRVDLKTQNVVSTIKTAMSDVTNCKTFERGVRLVLRGSARKTLVGGLVPFIPASELVFDDFVQIDATGAIVATEGDAIPDVLRGFQLVHRRFVTAPDNVQVVSNEQVGAFRTEFGGQKAAAAASARCFRWAKR